MASASRSKLKGKEPMKASSKHPGHGNSGSGISASGYNPLLGTFHTVETAPSSSAAAVHVNGRFLNIDETEDHSGNSFGPGMDYDSLSNNGSWSGESEEQKEKMSHPPPRQEAVPGADNDKREKIRQKNEKKHQRQKERRAQELHERCSGYLMSRKLEALAQQLVAMGFSQERATMALILNEGRVEESVAWLFEGGEEAGKHKEPNLESGGNLKIDISEELARIADMEIRYNCSKQEVERVLVVCEGDLEKAEDSLKAQKQEPPAAAPKPEETGDPPTVGNGQLPVAVSQNSVRLQTKASTTIPQKRDDKDFSYTKFAATAGSSVDSKSMQSLRSIEPRMEWAKAQQIAAPVDKMWSGAGSSTSVSYSLTSPLQASLPPAKTEARYVAMGNELKNLQLGSVREPVIVMQRPQSLNAKPIPSSNMSSSPPVTAAGWYPNSVETVKPLGLMPSISGSRSPAPNAANTNQFHNNHQQQQLQLQLQQQQQLQLQQQQRRRQQQQQHFVSSSSSVESLVPGNNNGLWSMPGTSPTLAPASSLGLFSGFGTNDSLGLSSPVDWSKGNAVVELDYTNIDWSLDRRLSMPRPGSLSPVTSSFVNKSNRTYESLSSALGIKTAMRPVPPNGSVVSVSGLHDGVSTTEVSAAAGSRVWTSPFEERDLFGLTRQFVSSPSL